MPISSISTILIHNHAPVMENAAILKNAGKQHFAGVLANNRNQSYFIGVFLQTTLIVQNFSNCINRINTVNTRVRVTCYAFFGKPYFPHTSKSHLLNYPYYINYPITYSIQLYRYYNTVITL